jgi:hypothetical protein
MVRADEHREAPLSDVLSKIASAYYDTPNFEIFLHLIECMLSAKRSRLGFALPDSQKLAFNAFMDPTPRLAGVVKDPALESFGTDMMARIADFLDDAIGRSSIEKQGVVRNFLLGVAKKQALRISTLNYDDAIERSIQDYWDGFTSDDPGSVDYEGFAITHHVELLHLHGSIRFAPSAPTLEPKGLPELVRFNTNKAAAPFRSRPLLYSTSTQAGERIFIGPMLSGLRKTDKLVIEPYGLYHHRFVAGLLASPRFLSVGYGGGDVYVNAAAAQARRFHGENFRAVYIIKIDENFAIDENVAAFDPLIYRALNAAASHSIQYAHEYGPFIHRLMANDRCLEENGMLLIASGFPISEELCERVATFLQ